MFPGFPARISDMRNRFSALSRRAALAAILYELHVVGQKIRLSSTPLKLAEPTPRSA